MLEPASVSPERTPVTRLPFLGSQVPSHSDPSSLAKPRCFLVFRPRTAALTHVAHPQAGRHTRAPGWGFAGGALRAGLCGRGSMARAGANPGCGDRYRACASDGFCAGSRAQRPGSGRVFSSGFFLQPTGREASGSRWAEFRLEWGGPDTTWPRRLGYLGLFLTLYI